MKTLFLKNKMPISIAVMAIAGAFATTSMQSTSSAYQLKTGYVMQQNGECNIAATCSENLTTVVCRITYPVGEQAFDVDPILGNCTAILYRP